MIALSRGTHLEQTSILVSFLLPDRRRLVPSTLKYRYKLAIISNKFADTFGNGGCRMSVSIKDVAEKAGVSIASVSRVLSGKPGVGKATEKRIRQVIEELDYRPNLGARGLVKKTTGNIAVVVPRGSFTLNNPFFTTVLSGIAKGIDQTEYNIIMSFTSTQQKKLLEEQSVDGVILFSPRAEEMGIEWLRKIGLPIVVIGSYLEESPFPCVRPDDVDGIRQAVHALHRLGHRKIGLINGPMSSMHSIHCLKGYQEAINELDLVYSSSYTLQVDEFDILDAVDAISAFLNDHREFSGVVCASDYLAIGALKAASNLGLGIPDDLSIVGIDDVPLASFNTPALSSVHVDLEGIGKKSTELLIEMLQGGQVKEKEHVFDMQYVGRESTSPPKES